jgi:hypothetical protein
MSTLAIHLISELLEMLRQWSYRGARYVRVAGLPPSPACARYLEVRRLALEPQGSAAPVRYAATVAKLTNTMQPEDIRLLLREFCYGI